MACAPAVDERDEAGHTAEVAVGHLLLGGRVDQHPRRSLSDAGDAARPRGRPRASRRSRTSRRTAGRASRPACSPAPCGGPGSARARRRRRSIRARTTAATSEKLPGAEVERRANELGDADDPRSRRERDRDSEHDDRRGERRPGPECGEALANPGLPSSASERSSASRELRPAGAADRKNDAAFSAKNALIGSTVSSKPASAQPPTERASAVARTSPFACWTFRRSTSAGRRPP